MQAALTVAGYVGHGIHADTLALLSNLEEIRFGVLGAVRLHFARQCRVSLIPEGPDILLSFF